MAGQWALCPPTQPPRPAAETHKGVPAGFRSQSPRGSRSGQGCPRPQRTPRPHAAGRCCHHSQIAATGHTRGQATRARREARAQQPHGRVSVSPPWENALWPWLPPGPSDNAHARVGVGGGGAAGLLGGAPPGLPIACSADAPPAASQNRAPEAARDLTFSPAVSEPTGRSWTSCINLNKATRRKQVAEAQVWADARSRKFTTPEQRRQQRQGGAPAGSPEPTVQAQELARREHKSVPSHGRHHSPGHVGGPGRGGTGPPRP